MKQTTSQSWDWYEKSTQHIYNWLITGPRHFRGTGLLHWIASALKTNLSFKHRNAFYKNEAIIRLSSHHTMQRKPEDRVFTL